MGTEALEAAAKLREDFHRGLLIDVEKTTFKDYATKWPRAEMQGQGAEHEVLRGFLAAV